METDVVMQMELIWNSVTVPAQRILLTINAAQDIIRQATITLRPQTE